MPPSGANFAQPLLLVRSKVAPLVVCGRRAVVVMEIRFNCRRASRSRSRGATLGALVFCARRKVGPKSVAPKLRALGVCVRLSQKSGPKRAANNRPRESQQGQFQTGPKERLSFARTCRPQTSSARTPILAATNCAHNCHCCSLAHLLARTVAQ